MRSSVSFEGFAVNLRRPRLRRALDGARTRLTLSFLLGGAIFLLLFTSSAFAQKSLKEGIAAFADELLARAGNPALVSIAVENRSSLSEADVKRIGKAVEARLREKGVRVATSERALAEVKLIVSENLQGVLWIAEIQQGLNKQVLMFSAGRPESEKNGAAAQMTLRKTLVGVFDEQVLDFEFRDEKTMFLLTPTSLKRYVRMQNEWHESAAFPIEGAVIRGVVGRILFQSEEIVGHVGDKRCVLFHDRNQLQCSDSGVPFDVHEVGLSSAKPRDWRHISAECTEGAQRLVTGGGDHTHPDFAQVWTSGKEPSFALTEKVMFPGPLTAVWEGIDEQSVHAVMRNLANGKYELYVLDITCGD